MMKTNDDIQTMHNLLKIYEAIDPSAPKTYLFFRESGFYPIELSNDYNARRNAEVNPGTIRVENAITGEVIWQQPPTPPHG